LSDDMEIIDIRWL